MLDQPIPSFLSQVLQYSGKGGLFERFFFDVIQEIEARGIGLEFGTFDDLAKINTENREAWRPLLSSFQPGIGGATEANGFVILGRNAAGEVIATQALRIFDWPDTTFKQEAQSLRLLYAVPKRDRLPDEACIVTADIAEQISGRVGFSGAVWNRPDYRGRQLSDLIPRLSRVFGLVRYQVDSTCAFMSGLNVANQLHVRAGFKDVSETVVLRNTRSFPDGDLNMHLCRQRPADIRDDAFNWLTNWRSKIDIRVMARRA